MENRNITPEEAKAELARRELARRDSERSLLSRSNIPNNDYTQNIQNAFGKPGEFRNPLNLLRDISVGLGNAGQSIGQNMVKAVGRTPGPEINMQELFGPKNPDNFDRFVQGAVLPAITAYGGGLSVPGQLVSGGLTGLLTSKPDQQNYLLPNGAIGAGIENSLISAAPLGAGKLLQKGFSARASNVANKMLEAETKQDKLYEDKYTNFFNKAKQHGIRAVPQSEKSNVNYDLILNEVPGTWTQNLEKYMKNRTLKKGHEAQSDLAKADRYWEQIYKNKISTLSGPQIKAHVELKKAIKEIRNEMKSAMTNKSRPDLVKEYSDITQGYKRDVVPYQENPELQALKNKEIGNFTFANKVGKNEKFMIAKGHEHPEIRNRNVLKTLLKYVGPPGLVGLGYQLWKHHH